MSEGESGKSMGGLGMEVWTSEDMKGMWSARAGRREACIGERAGAGEESGWGR